MKIRVCEERVAMGAAAAAEAGRILRRSIERSGRARIMAGRGSSLDETLDALVAERGVNWAEVELFHVGEFVGLPIEHPASCRRYLVDRLISKARPGRYHLLDGMSEPERVCREEGEELRAAPIDVAVFAVGENGSLAFNEPPADFAIEKPYLVMRLDEPRRRREAVEGGFDTPADVPDRAISISLRQLMQARAIVCVAPGATRADSVRRCQNGTVSPLLPVSLLRTHPAATLYVDRAAASLMKQAG